MDLNYLSLDYDVRKLDENDIDLIYELSIDNTLYYKYCPPFVTRQSIKNDMKGLPPTKEKNDKFYIGFFDKDTLVAIMDLILFYPNPDTSLIGLFMMQTKYQGKGTGTKIIEDCSKYLKSLGFNYIHLGFAKGNPQSEAFWLKNKFISTGREKVNEGYTVVLMQREL